MINRRSLSVQASVDDDGNLVMGNLKKLKEWASLNKSSSLNIIFIANDKNTSKSLISYYRNVVLIEMQNGYRETQGERVSLEKVDEELRHLSPIMHKIEEDNGIMNRSVETYNIYNCGNIRAVEFLEHIKQIAAEEFDIYINDPKKV